MRFIELYKKEEAASQLGRERMHAQAHAHSQAHAHTISVVKENEQGEAWEKLKRRKAKGKMAR